MVFLDLKEIKDEASASLILSKKQWERICHTLKIKAERAEAIRAKEAEVEQMREASQNMIKTWKNTIAGLRRQRLDARKIKAFADEEKRVYKDLEEAEYQDKRRKFVLTQAKKRLYFQTDRAKRFNGALAFAQTLKERDEQIAFKENSKNIYKLRDEEYVNCMKQDEEDFKIDLRKEKELADEKKKVVSHNLKIQIRKNAEDREEKKLLSYRESKITAEATADYEKEEEQLKIKDKVNKVEFRKQLDDSVAKKKQYQAALDAMEKSDHKRAEIFVEGKRRMVRLRKEKDEIVKREKKKRQDKIVENINKIVGKQRLEEEELMKNAVTEKDAAVCARIRKEAENRQAFIKEMLKVNAQQHDLKESLKIKDKAKELDFWRQLKDKAEADEVIEQEKVRKWVKAEKKNQVFVKDQMSEAKYKKSKEAMTLMGEQLAHYEMLQNEEDDFQRFAKKVIDQCEKEKMNTYPLRQAAQAGIECGRGPVYHDIGGLRPKALSADEQQTDMMHINQVKPKQRITVKDRRRLGFAY